MAAQNPEDWRTAAAMAEQLLTVKRPEQAITTLQKAIAKHPQVTKLYCLLSLAWLDLKKSENALQAAGRALTTDPESEWAHRLRSVALGRMERHDEALLAAIEAARSAPDEPLALLNLANCQLQSSLVTQAEISGQRLRKIDPESASTHNLFGRIALLDNNKPLARSYFEKSLALKPQESAYHQNLGLAHMGSGRLGEAEKRFREGLRVNPTNRPLRDLWTKARRRRYYWAGAALALLAGIASILYGLFH